MPSLALADRNGVYGSARFHTSAKHNGIKAHIGAEIAVSSFGNDLIPPDWLPPSAWSLPNRPASCCSVHRRPAIRTSVN